MKAYSFQRRDSIFLRGPHLSTHVEIWVSWIWKSCFVFISIMYLVLMVRTNLCLLSLAARLNLILKVFLSNIFRRYSPLCCCSEWLSQRLMLVLKTFDEIYSSLDYEIGSGWICWILECIKCLISHPKLK